MADLLEQLNDETAALLEGVQRSLVEIRNGRGGVGSGIIWHPSGLIVTNAHVIGRGPLRIISKDGHDLTPRVLAYDAHNDVAALTVGAKGLPAVEIGDSRQLQAGQLVFAIGHPWGVAGAVTAGIVVGAQPETLGMPSDGREWIVASLQLRPGHSGGPLVDAGGRLVGINTMINGPDIGLALPVHVVKDFLARATAPLESRSWIKIA